MSRGHFIGLNHHRLMLADDHRMQTYASAIAECVRPGDVVLDLGTGTGVLACWAARAGARVYAVEPHDIVQVAQRVARDNGLQTITFIQQDARQLQLDEPVDWLITECMGNFFVTDEMQPVLRDARRFLAPGGRTIPRTISLYLAPVWLPLWNELDFWREPIGGLDYRGALDFAQNRSYVLHVEPEFVIGPAVEMQSFALLDSPDSVGGTFELRFARKVRCDGVIGWFDAQLTDNVQLTTAPGQRTHWGQMLFPIEPHPVTSETTLRFELELSLDPAYQWTFRWGGSWGGDAREPHPFEHDSRWRFGRPAEGTPHSN